jgi:uncharacterized protein YdaU (DUF1376 family)
MHYYQHHIGDFIKDTTHLDDHQLAAYLRMLWAYYTSESPISGDFEDVAFAMRTDEKTVRLLLRHFFTETPDGWHHTRCDKEIADYHSKAEKARNSANARWKNADAVRTHSERNPDATVFDANQEPITKNQEPVIKKQETGKQRGSRLPADCLLPTDWFHFCKQERPDLVPKQVFDEFRDYWIAQPGQKGVKTDWDATWRNWVRRQNQARTGGRTEHKHAAAARAIFDGVFDNE